MTGSVDVAGADWVTKAGGSLWVSQETNRVARVDPAALKVTASVPVKRNPLGTAVVRGQLWVPCIDSGVIVVIDPATAKVVRTMPGGPSPIVVLPAPVTSGSRTRPAMRCGASKLPSWSCSTTATASRSSGRRRT